MPFSIEYKDVVDKLVGSSPEFKKLYEDHHKLDDQVKELFNRVSLSPEEELELSKLKKIKLVLRDEMQKMLDSLM